MELPPESYWTAVANVVPQRPYGPGGQEIRPGTKHFAPGAKVYIIDWFAGTCTRVVAVGLHRQSKRMIRVVMAVDHLESFRAQVCYAPVVIAHINAHFAPPDDIRRLSQEFAEQLRDVLPIWKAEMQQPKPAA